MHSTLSSGAVSRGLTSTYAPVASDNFFRPMNSSELREEIYPKVKNAKRKGYVSVVFADSLTLNIELHCDIATRACDRFLSLCKSGNFLSPLIVRDGVGVAEIPSTDAFRQEKDSRLSLEPGALILTEDELFVVLKSSVTLDASRKYSIFASVVGSRAGLELISRSDGKSFPFTRTSIVEDPFEIIPAEAAERAAAEQRKQQSDSFLRLAQSGDAMVGHPNRHSTSIGKYITGIPAQPRSSLLAPKPSRRKPYTFESWP